MVHCKIPWTKKNGGRFDSEVRVHFQTDTLFAVTYWTGYRAHSVGFKNYFK
jgi:hypothetical protein